MFSQNSFLRRINILRTILTFAVVIVLLVYMTLPLSNRTNYGRSMRIMNTLAVAKSDILSPTKIDLHLHHPANLDDLWLSVNKYLLIRRMGYFDTRNRSHVGIVFISMHDDRHPKKPTLYAHITYNDSTTICVEMEYWAQSSTLNNKNSREYWVAYVLRNKHMLLSMEAPLMASICTNSLCHTTTLTIPIQSDTSDKNLTYGVCLHQPLYDLGDPQLLVDWVELNLALGAEIITVYLQNVPESFYTLMLPYIKRDVVEVIDWKLKPPIINGYTKCWGQVGTINECIYRNLYRVKYVALIDIDEFIVPQNNQSMTEVLYNLHLLRPIASSYTFLNTLFTKDGVSLPEVKSSIKCHHMSWPRYYTFTLQCAHPNIEAKLFHWHKIVLKPQAVISAWVHWPIKVLPGYDITYYVPVNIGLTHHYRVMKKKDGKVCRSKKKPQKKQSYTISLYFNQTFKGIMKTIC